MSVSEARDFIWRILDPDLATRATPHTLQDHKWINPPMVEVIEEVEVPIEPTAPLV